MTERAIYVISVVAELVGVHPQTLRNYERAGLLVPSRTAGGTRRFSESDLSRLRHIIELTAAGVNLEGVKRVLALEDEMLRRSATPAQPASTALVPIPSKSVRVHVLRRS